MTRLFSARKKVLGIIGGMGPMASAYFGRLLVEMADVDTDQQHLPTILLNIPEIPDRTAYILGRSEESPVPVLTAAAKTLEGLGADFCAVTCVTSHCFYDEVQSAVSIPWINIVQETAAALKAEGVRKAGILATDGTIETGIFQKALSDEGILWAAPSEENQAKVMHLIYQDIKAGRKPEMELFGEVTRAMKEELQCDACILGCTELSLIKRDYETPGCIDAMEALARASLIRCGIPVREEYRRLIR